METRHYLNCRTDSIRDELFKFSVTLTGRALGNIQGNGVSSALDLAGENIKLFPGKVSRKIMDMEGIFYRLLPDF